MRSYNTGVHVCAEHHWPFSLFNACKHIKTKKVGAVEEVMDRSIGRFALKITGSVSANNYVEYENLNLKGSFVYFQFKLVSKVATIHLELMTDLGHSLRVTLSTLYLHDQPKFFGRSLRLPIATNTENQWTILVLDINSILAKYCSTGSMTEALSHVKVSWGLLASI